MTLRSIPIRDTPVGFSSVLHLKSSSSIAVTVSDTNYGSDVTISCILTQDATGYVECLIGEEYYEKKAITTLGSITFTVSGLTLGNKTVTVTYLGDSNYTNSSSTTTFSVLKPIATSFTTRWAQKTYPNTYSSLTQIPQEGLDYLNSVRPDRLVSLFDGCNALTSVDVTNIDTSECINLRYIFESCKAITSIDLSTWDTSNVTFMESMFMGCTNLQIVDLTGWDTSSVVASDAMEYMFTNCSNLQYLILGDANKIFNTIDSNCGGLNSTCKILVPQSVLSTYQAATNWSTKSSQFEAIENYNITRSNGQVSVTDKVSVYLSGTYETLENDVVVTRYLDHIDLDNWDSSNQPDSAYDSSVRKPYVTYGEDDVELFIVFPSNKSGTLAIEVVDDQITTYTLNNESSATISLSLTAGNYTIGIMYNNQLLKSYGIGIAKSDPKIIVDVEDVVY